MSSKLAGMKSCFESKVLAFLNIFNIIVRGNFYFLKSSLLYISSDSHFAAFFKQSVAAAFKSFPIDKELSVSLLKFLKYYVLTVLSFDDGFTITSTSQTTFTIVI
jgi:hypothetical protein